MIKACPSTTSKKLHTKPASPGCMCYRAGDPPPLLNAGTGKALWLLSKAHQRANMYPHMFRIAIKPENARSMQQAIGTHKARRKPGRAGVYPVNVILRRCVLWAHSWTPLEPLQLLLRSPSSLGPQKLQV